MNKRISVAAKGKGIVNGEEEPETSKQLNHSRTKTRTYCRRAVADENKNLRSKKRPSPSPLPENVQNSRVRNETNERLSAAAKGKGIVPVNDDKFAVAAQEELETAEQLNRNITYSWVSGTVMNFTGFSSLRLYSLVSNFATIKTTTRIDFLLVFSRSFNAHFSKSQIPFSNSTCPSVFSSKFKNFNHANHLFDEIPLRNILEWNSMIKAYANNGLQREAISLYCQMQERGISPDNFTFPSVLKACSSIPYLRHVKKIHGDIKLSRFEYNLQVQNALLVAYVKCRELDLARQVFNEMPQRNLISWSAIISGFANSSKVEEAVLLFKSMLLAGERPNYVTILGVIRAFSGLEWEEHTGVIHGLVIKIGFESYIPVVTALLGLYSLHEKMESVHQLFEKIPTKDLVLWSAMVASHSKNGQSTEAIQIFRKMQHRGMKPNQVSIVSVLPACADLGALLQGKQVHAFSIIQGFFLDTNLQNSLISMYAKCGKPDASFLVFNGIKNKDLISWNTMISGFSENMYPEKALILFYEMRSFRIEPDQTTIQNIIISCSRMEELQFGIGLHCYIVKNGLSMFVSVATALLKMYADFGEVEMSSSLFKHLFYKDQIAWSAMVSVYARAGHSNLALGVFKQMQIAGEKPNAITLVSLLQACSSMGAREQGKTIHSHVLRVGFESNVFVASTLIDFYCKFGRVNQAKSLFDQIPMKDLVCWGSMISGYGMNGCGREALETFSDMLQTGLKPNHVIFISVLSACSHCGLVSEGWKWFYAMKDLYKLEPSLIHYACMVDLLSRRGMINEALRFIEEMPVEPDAGVWGSLLAGCRLSPCFDIEIAELAAKELFRLEPENSSYHVMLSNMYAERGRWVEVEGLRRFAKVKGLRKTMGYSMVEL